MKRGDWEARASAEIERWRGVRFAWGKRDCCRFAAAIVRAMTGRDPMRGLRGKSASKRAALRLIAEQPIAQRLDAKFERVPPAFAQRGDIVMTDGSVGIFWAGAGLFLGAEGEAEGLVSVPRAEFTGVWRVG